MRRIISRPGPMRTMRLSWYASEVERLPCHSLVDRHARDRARLAHEDARIDGLREEVLRAEAEVLIAVGAADLVDHFLASQLRQGAGRGHEHLFGDPRRMRVERARA